MLGRSAKNMNLIIKVILFVCTILSVSCEKPEEQEAKSELTKVKTTENPNYDKRHLGFAFDGSKLITAKLTKVETDETDDIVSFICSLELENNCGKSFSVTSGFYSAFDQFELIITDPMDNLLIQLPYTYHQSPHSSKGSKFTIEEGVNTKELRFPIFLDSGINLPKKVLVRLVGTLPESRYVRILSTNTITLTRNQINFPLYK
jgi:hypothetical protein